ncbi:MAG: hypothetical protein IPI05_13640 [Flavobacteriales bacterium]|nr:hypothetical protein [Flavobacteriales bacterium]
MRGAHQFIPFHFTFPLAEGLATQLGKPVARAFAERVTTAAAGSPSPSG